MMRISTYFLVITALVVDWSNRPVSGQGVNASEVLGKEFSATVHVPKKEVTVEGVLFLPEKVAQADGVITIVDWGFGRTLYEDSDWRNLCERLRSGLLLVALKNDGETTDNGPVIAQQAVRNAVVGGGEGLLILLERLAEQSGHSEIKNAKLLLWGHSAAGSFAMTFATLYPQRTIGFVRYHSHLRELPVDVESAAHTPGLLLAGDADTAAGVEDCKALWQKGRSFAAPWTLGIEPGVSHSDPEGLRLANKVAIPWVTAVFQLRKVRGDEELGSISKRSGWLGNLRTGEISSHESFSGVRQEASWLPDETTARGWQIVTGHAR